MTAVPAVPTFTSTTLTASQLNALGAALTFALDPPIIQIRQTSAQSIPDGVWTSITCSVEDVKHSFTHSGGSPSRIVAVYPGRHLISGAASWAFNATGSRGARIAVNGTAVDGAGALQDAVSASYGNTVPVPALFIYLNVGDYAEIQGFQDHGSALNTSSTATAQSFLVAEWVGNS